MPKAKYVCRKGFRTDLNGLKHGDPKRKEVKFEPGDDVPAKVVEKISPWLLHEGLVEMVVEG